MLGCFLPGRYLMMSTDHGFARHGKVRSRLDFSPQKSAELYSFWLCLFIAYIS